MRQKTANLFGVSEGTFKKEGLSDKMKQKLNPCSSGYAIILAVAGADLQSAPPLVAGSRIIDCIYPHLTRQKILIDEEARKIQLNAQFEYSSGCYPSFGVIYFHALIPKTENNFDVSFKVDVSKN